MARYNTILNDTSVYEDTSELLSKIVDCMYFIEDCEDKWSNDSRAVNLLNQMNMCYSQLEKCYNRLTRVL